MPSSWRLALLAALLTTISAAQNVNNVPLQPSGIEKLHADIDANPQTYTKPFVSNVDLVLVPVTVTDQTMRIVTGLEPSNFAVLEDDHPQSIKYFYTQDTPISIGIILDVDRRPTSVKPARYAISRFIKASNEDDEFFLIYSDKPRLVTDFTNRPEDIYASLLSERPSDRTARYDAIYLGLNKMKEAKYARRVLMVFSDGSGNASQVEFHTVCRAAGSSQNSSFRRTSRHSTESS